ncbi:hypothetical protein AACH06_25535 [Ideonella sp. DXS29W]|uniref:Uncharacterized protein n=1 Tax=Ideonella lacteola TaxID=2984193 RepID=A0ABU9BXP6_9BURK
MQDFFKLRVTFCDSENNGFVTLGGAGFDTASEWEQQWDTIPAADLGYDDPGKLILDKIDQRGDLVEERPITRAIAEALLGEPLETLIERGRASTAFTWGQAKAAIEATSAIKH